MRHRSTCKGLEDMGRNLPELPWEKQFGAAMKGLIFLGWKHDKEKKMHKVQPSALNAGIGNRNCFVLHKSGIRGKTMGHTTQETEEIVANDGSIFLTRFCDGKRILANQAEIFPKTLKIVKYISVGTSEMSIWGN